MKSAITAICLLILVILFVIIDRKDFYSGDDVVREESVARVKSTTVTTFETVDMPTSSAVETKPMPEVKPTIDNKPAPEKEIATKVDPPSAVPALSPEEAMIVNAEAIAAFAKKPATIRPQEDLHDLDFGKDVVNVLLWFIPVSIIFFFLLQKRGFKIFSIGRKPPSHHIRYSYSPLLLLLLVVFAQWINVFCNKNENDYDSIFYEKRVISSNDEWSKVNDKLCQVQISYGIISSPAVFVDGIALQELLLQDLKGITQKSEIQFPFFSRNGGYIVFPNTYVGKEVDVYLERQVFSWIKNIFSIRGCLKTWFWIYMFWLFVQLYINKGFTVVSKKKFRQKCLLVCLTSFSVILAGAFWMSNIPLETSSDGKGYISLACSDTIMRCLYGTRTPGYPLFLSVISLFSPSSFHSTIYFQVLLYLLSLTWLLYELFKKGVPMIVILVAYFLFYDYLSHFFSYVLCESLEISSIAATAAIGLSLSNLIIKKHTVKFIIFLALTIALVFCTMMIKPFPGLILLPGCMMFLGLLGSIKFSKAFVLTILVGVLSVLLPASYCMIRWKMCSDFNFCSLINTTCGAYQLTVSTPESLAAERIRPEQRELAYEVIQFFEFNRPDLKLEHPWLNKDSTLEIMQKYRMQFLYHDGLYSFFWRKWEKLDKEQREKFKDSAVYANDQCRAFLKMGDPELRKIMMSYYWDEVKKLYSEKPRWVSDNLIKYNPFKKSFYFHKKVTCPAIICLLIALLSCCKKIRYGSWKTIVVIVGFAAIPILTYFAQVLWLDSPVFEARSEMVMFFSAMLGTILLSLYCIYCCIISLILALRLLYLKYAPENIKHFFGGIFRRHNSLPANT